MTDTMTTQQTQTPPASTVDNSVGVDKPARRGRPPRAKTAKSAADTGKTAGVTSKSVAKPGKVAKATKTSKAGKTVATKVAKPGKTAVVNGAKTMKPGKAATATKTTAAKAAKPGKGAKPKSTGSMKTPARSAALLAGTNKSRSSTAVRRGPGRSAGQSVGSRIVALRTGKGMTQGDLAKSLGISRSAVAQWETDRCSQSTDKIEAMAKLFGVTPGYLLSGAVNGHELGRTENRLINGFRCLGQEDRVMIVKLIERLGKSPTRA